MSPKGRHSARSNVARDAGIMVVGVVVVGLIVYGIAWGVSALFGGSDEVASPDSTAAAAAPSSTTTTSTVVEETTTTTVSETTTPTTSVRDPSEVVVLVLNSVGTQGLAARVTETLADLGYQTLEPDDYVPEQERSQILFREGFGPEAFELAAAAVPDAEIGMNRDPGEADIVVLLGASFDG